MGDNETPAPVFNQHVYQGGVGAQGMTVTQNVGAAPSDLVGLVLQLRNLSGRLEPDRQEEFIADVDILEDPDQDPAPRIGAWQRIKGALIQGGTSVAASGIVAAGEQIVSSIAG